MKPFDRNKPISSKELAVCFDQLEETYGKSTIETIVYELEMMFGIIFTGSLSYRFSEIEDALTKLLGYSASEIMVDSILHYLKD